MKNITLFAIIAILPFFGQSQDMFRISLDSYQIVENGSMPTGNQMIKLPTGENTIIMGGLNDLDGMNNYFNVYGSKLIIDSLDTDANGTKKVVLRREDGRNFYDLFPTLTARLVPLKYEELPDITTNLN